MSKLHDKLIDHKKFELKEGQCDDLACSNKRSITHCPSLSYEYIKPPSEEQVNRAFDLLFEEILKIKS